VSPDAICNRAARLVLAGLHAALRPHALRWQAMRGWCHGVHRQNI